MASSTYDFTLVQGEFRIIAFRLKNRDARTWSYRAQIRDGLDKTVRGTWSSADGNITVEDYTDGHTLVYWTITAEESDAIPVGSKKYDLYATDDLGRTGRYLVGDIDVEGNITVPTV